MTTELEINELETASTLSSHTSPPLPLNGRRLWCTTTPTYGHRRQPRVHGTQRLQ